MQEYGLPFRESKLTRLLQHSLGGNAMSTLIATLSPADEAADENMSTLAFALSARQVKVQVTLMRWRCSCCLYWYWYD